MNFSRVSTSEDGSLAERVVSEAGPANDAAAASSRSQLVRITGELLQETCEFLHREMNGSLEDWKLLLCWPWKQQETDYGFALVRPNEGVVGVLVVIYSEQVIEGKVERFANLTHWCVKPAYRRESLRLIAAMNAQTELTLTAFSSRREVVKIMLRKGWSKLDDHLYLIPNLGISYRARKTQVLTSFDEIIAIVDERHKRIMLDHGTDGPGRYVLVTDGSQWCLSVFKIEIRRGVAFSAPVYFSDRDLFRRWMPRFLSVYRSLSGCWATLCQPRLLPSRPIVAIRLVEPRPHIFRSTSVAPANVTALYSDAVQ